MSTATFYSSSPPLPPPPRSPLFPYTTLFRSAHMRPPLCRNKPHTAMHGPNRWRKSKRWLCQRQPAEGCIGFAVRIPRSEEHTSELQSRGHLVCRLLLEKKKANQTAAAGSATC